MSSTRRPGLGPYDASAADAPDAAVVAFLRRELAPPAADGYWADLERRVMAGVRSGAYASVATPEWWQPFAGWVRMGLAAAGVAAIVAGAALLQSRDAERSAAYAAVLEPTAPVPAQSAAARDRLRAHAGPLGDPAAVRAMEQDAEREREREATFRYVITH